MRAARKENASPRGTPPLPFTKIEAPTAVHAPLVEAQRVPWQPQGDALAEIRTLEDHKAAGVDISLSWEAIQALTSELEAARKRIRELELAQQAQSWIRCASAEDSTCDRPTGGHLSQLPLPQPQGGDHDTMSLPRTPDLSGTLKKKEELLLLDDHEGVVPSQGPPWTGMNSVRLFQNHFQNWRATSQRMDEDGVRLVTIAVDDWRNMMRRLEQLTETPRAPVESPRQPIPHGSWSSEITREGSSVSQVVEVASAQPRQAPAPAQRGIGWPGKRYHDISRRYMPVSNSSSQRDAVTCTLLTSNSSLPAPGTPLPPPSGTVWAQGVRSRSPSPVQGGCPSPLRVQGPSRSLSPHSSFVPCVIPPGAAVQGRTASRPRASPTGSGLRSPGKPLGPCVYGAAIPKGWAPTRR